VFFFLLIFFLTGMALTVLLWAGTLFLQGYYYTEPTTGIAWQAPAAGFSLALFFTLWSYLIVGSPGASPGDLPYDTLFRFSPRVDKFKKTPTELWVEKKGIKEPLHYKLVKRVVGGRTQESYETDSGQKYSSSGVEAIVLKEDGQNVRYLPRPGPEGSGYREFVDDSGWAMREFPQSGPTGLPEAFRWGRFVTNLFLNSLHLALWFVCLWLLLRFAWAHALGLAVVLWLVMTLAILPMLLDESASRAPPASTRGSALSATFNLSVEST
jgi:hypothetical protein